MNLYWVTKLRTLHEKIKVTRRVRTRADVYVKMMSTCVTSNAVGCPRTLSEGLTCQIAPDHTRSSTSLTRMFKILHFCGISLLSELFIFNKWYGKHLRYICRLAWCLKCVFHRPYLPSRRTSAYFQPSWPSGSKKLKNL